MKYEIFDVNGTPVNSRREWGVRQDGILIFRYKIHSTIEKPAKLRIVHNDKLVHESQFEYIHDENCNCPLDYEEFLKIYNCPESFPQLDEDLDRFEIVDLDKVKSAGYNKQWERKG